MERFFRELKNVLKKVKKELRAEEKERVLTLWNEYRVWRGWQVTDFPDVNYNDSEFLKWVWEKRIAG